NRIRYETRNTPEAPTAVSIRFLWSASSPRAIATRPSTRNTNAVRLSAALSAGCSCSIVIILPGGSSLAARDHHGKQDRQVHDRGQEHVSSPARCPSGGRARGTREALDQHHRAERAGGREVG